MKQSDIDEMDEEEQTSSSKEEEASETPREESAESADEGDGSVKLSEEFQREITPYIDQATKPELEFIRNLCMEREKMLLKSESKEQKKGVFDMKEYPGD